MRSSGKMAVAMAVFGVASMASASTILMHVGATGTAVVGDGRSWNQVLAASTPLVDSTGAATTVTYSASPSPDAIVASTATGAAWHGVNGNAPAAGGIPAGSEAATRGYVTPTFSAFGFAQAYDTNATGFSGSTLTATLVSLTGLAPSSSYNVYIYADRVSGSGVRTGLYTLTGASSSQVVFDGVADGAAGNVGKFLNAQTDATGKFTLDVRTAANNNNVNGFCYLGVLEVESVPEPTSVGLVGLGSLALLKRRRA